MILLDTNVVSELMRATPDARVAAFFARHRLVDLYLPSVCEGDRRYGIVWMPTGARRDQLVAALQAFLDQGFASRVIAYDSACAEAYAAARAGREARGRPIDTEDAQILGTALAYGGAVATRNVTHFDASGVTVLNPWGEAP